MSKFKKFGTVTIGGGGGSAAAAASTPNSNLYYIVGGNTLPYLGAPGIKHVSTTITTTGTETERLADGVPSNLPDGIGWIRSIDNGSMHLAVNDSTSYVSFDMTSQVVYAMMTGTISGGSGEDVFEYSKYTICGAI